ncbi:MAG: phosphoribosylformylglycinamidine synthase subunit PurL [Planctomycetes bacterium]|nr:phosphoribosylformylglycinamidine synthase subunit PurL [Planctomycetota bacterium]MCP4860059.1 phosphoribosylformylglycinamidine synthase subunit PurL [Planctomycetota bacterium]
MSSNAWRVELELNSSRIDPLGAAAVQSLAARGLPLTDGIRVGRGFLLPGSLDRDEVKMIVDSLLADPVNETARIVAPGEVETDGQKSLLIRRMAGVSDPEAHTTERALKLLDIDLPSGTHVETYRSYRCLGEVAGEQFLKIGGRALGNLTIEEAFLANEPVGLHPEPTSRPSKRRDIPLRDLGIDELSAISSEMSLALTGEEMVAIQEFFVAEGREPSDVELETLAQTWSEHCKHKTLTGPVSFQQLDGDGKIKERRHYNNLLKETVFYATQKLSPEWCWSVFKDNAGVIAMTEDIGIAIKVETHNHPSALDPYGGSGTGIGGVIRDILGTGLGARPFASTDVFCVGEENMDRKDLPPGTMHPDRILDGVVAGVRDYGNRMGIPTVAGTVIRHPGYVANPLVFAGSLGEIPRKYVDKAARPGDLIVAFGGRTGRDGIHGATFSSEALHEDSESIDAAAVQIGDPITEKKVLDVLMVARDRDIFTAVTDCGAGGFSSAVGEMGEEIGAEVNLEGAPLKYAGLSYWEIWISEAQERMVAAIPPAKLDELQHLCDTADVELTVLGTFADHERLILRWHGEVVCDMPMSFLHGGVPQPVRDAIAPQTPQNDTAWPSVDDHGQLLQNILGHPSVASKEWVVRQYDHEVQGGTVLKPYQGANGHGAGDGTVVKPRLDLPQGVALGCGIYPRMAELDPYAATANAIDEALRNTVAAGGNPHRTAILDNFCWGDCRKPDRFGSMVLAAEACRDAAIAYGTPFVSGKDSLNNEYRVDGVEKAIPPTLLCTAMAIVEDCEQTVGTPLQAAGNHLVMVGFTSNDGGGTVASDLLGLEDSVVPKPNFETAPSVFAALHSAITEGSVAACHDLSEGGLAVAAAEMVIGAHGLGASVDISRVPGASDLSAAARLYAETPTRFLVEVPADRLEQFGSHFRTLPWAAVGEVQAGDQLELRDGPTTLVNLDSATLSTANRVQA